jgi:hypothetical protein
LTPMGKIVPRQASVKSAPALMQRPVGGHPGQECSDHRAEAAAACA